MRQGAFVNKFIAIACISVFNGDNSRGINMDNQEDIKHSSHDH